MQHRINLINAKEGFEVAADKKILINEAMASIEFTFSKIGEEELEIASRDELQSTYARLIHDFTTFDDQADEEFISLRDAFIQRFHEYGFEIDTVAKFNEQKKMLDEIMERLHKLQIANRALAEHYNGDAKYARIHKRIREENQRRQRHQNEHLIAKADDLVIEQVLKCIKAGIDEVVYDDYHILKKDAYFRQTVQHIIGTYTSSVINLGATREDWEFMTPRIYQQYVEQYDRTYSAA